MLYYPTAFVLGYFVLRHGLLIVCLFIADCMSNSLRTSWPLVCTLCSRNLVILVWHCCKGLFRFNGNLFWCRINFATLETGTRNFGKSRSLGFLDTFDCNRTKYKRRYPRLETLKKRRDSKISKIKIPQSRRSVGRNFREDGDLSLRLSHLRPKGSGYT